jgi:NAD(P)-dependent dehydrogenase (short-subunit alcohol dehydrogenase family)
MMKNPFLLSGKNILITGASSGIGRETAIILSNLGANIILLGRNPGRLAETREQLDTIPKSLVIVHDLCNYSLTGYVLETIKNEIGALDAIVHSAGISGTIPFRQQTWDKLEKIWQINVASSIELTRIAVNKSYWNPDGGTILFLASVMGLVGESAKTMYSLTKGALIAGARSLAIELAPRKIRVNCIAPGIVDTPMTQQAVYSQSPETKEKISILHPLGLGRPEDIAYAAAFLCSGAARWITGITLTVDGGYTAR